MNNQFAMLLNALAKETGLNELKPDENQRCSLSFNNLIVSLQYMARTNTILIYSALCGLPRQGKEALYARLLEANYIFKETAGAILSINREGEFVGLHLELALNNLEPSEFIERLEKFISVAEYWAQECSKEAEIKENLELVNHNWVQA